MLYEEDETSDSYWNIGISIGHLLLEIYWMPQTDWRLNENMLWHLALLCSAIMATAHTIKVRLEAHVKKITISGLSPNSLGGFLVDIIFDKSCKSDQISITAFKPSRGGHGWILFPVFVSYGGQSGQSFTKQSGSEQEDPRNVKMKEW